MLAISAQFLLCNRYYFFQGLQIEKWQLPKILKHKCLGNNEKALSLILHVSIDITLGQVWKEVALPYNEMHYFQALIERKVSRNEKVERRWLHPTFGRSLLLVGDDRAQAVLITVETSVISSGRCCVSFENVWQFSLEKAMAQSTWYDTSLNSWLGRWTSVNLHRM